ncbi:MAG: potassium-transporting ATPase subunit F [Planctomycetales bacterium]|nr:potassium-transporting ATPase subunit F [Planctomycetales bacterium]
MRYFLTVTRTEGVRNVDAYHVLSRDLWVRTSLGTDQVDRTISRCPMNAIVVLVVVFSFAYLTYAMLRPEKF